ncbi:hypothetical protein AVEN_56317-1 [Araneus ventricosus]|uniref:Uncharacterized protein n=1 Tax=Araneus ventricosus TaxID=182803 RepID=A0A4Y2QIZ6_ARAVE|nr:hypothetical protein AVEN_56317-1 [Araneus ventricosus]
MSLSPFTLRLYQTAALCEQLPSSKEHCHSPRFCSDATHCRQPIIQDFGHRGLHSTGLNMYTTVRNYSTAAFLANYAIAKVAPIGLNFRREISCEIGYRATWRQTTEDICLVTIFQTCDVTARDNRRKDNLLNNIRIVTDGEHFEH